MSEHMHRPTLEFQLSSSSFQHLNSASRQHKGVFFVQQSLTDLPDVMLSYI